MISLWEKVREKSRSVVYQAFVPLTSDLQAGPPALVEAIRTADLATFLQATFNLAISVGAIIAVLKIGFAGFKYMTTEAITSKGEAKKMIQDAVIGLLLLLAIIIILRQINPNLLNMNFNLGSAGNGAGQVQPNGFDSRVK